MHVDRAIFIKHASDYSIQSVAGLRDALSISWYVQVYHIAKLAEVLCQLALKQSRTMNPQPVFAWEFIDLSRPHQTIALPWAAPVGTCKDGHAVAGVRTCLRQALKHLQVLGSTYFQRASWHQYHPHLGLYNMYTRKTFRRLAHNSPFRRRQNLCSVTVPSQLAK